MRTYKEGYILKDDEYLLKIRKNKFGPDTGFLTKFNKNGSIPSAFESWGVHYTEKESLPIYVVTETFQSGWQIYDWRFGQSQNWAIMIHPDEYTVEIHLDNLLEIIQSNNIAAGEIIGEFKWEKHKLIKK